MFHRPRMQFRICSSIFGKTGSNCRSKVHSGPTSIPASATGQKQAIVRKHNPKLTEFIEYLLHSEYPIEKEQEIERIKAIMQELPPQCLKVFMLSTIEEEKEKKYTGIANEFSISINTVKTHISKAYRLIRFPIDPALPSRYQIQKAFER